MDSDKKKGISRESLRKASEIVSRWPIHKQAMLGPPPKPFRTSDQMEAEEKARFESELRKRKLAFKVSLGRDQKLKDVEDEILYRALAERYPLDELVAELFERFIERPRDK